MNWIVLTLFPAAFRGGIISESILGRAAAQGLLGVTAVDIREFADPPHRVCDDSPYGGGPGMVMKPEPIVRAFRASAGEADAVLALSASGELFNDEMARDLSRLRNICLLCGHYEGIDQRALDAIGAREISIGNFLLTGGEIAALAVIDAVSRYIPGVLGKEASRAEESFALPGGVLEYPHYTRPVVFEGRDVPEVLRSGDHAAISEWRARQAILRTARRRPDLLDEKKILSTSYGQVYVELKKEGVLNGQSNRDS